MVKPLTAWIPVMAAMAGCAAAAAPPVRPVLRPARPALAGCVGDGNQIRLEAAATDAPVVVLTERRIGLGWQAELAMWADGSVIFDPVSGEDSSEYTTLETRVPAAAVEALRARVYDQLAGAPRQVDRGGGHIGRGRYYAPVHGPRTEVIVRGPDGWRVAFVAGIDRDDVLATDADRRREAERVRAEAEAFMADRARAIARGERTATDGLDLTERGTWVPDPVPAWFVDVYRTLLGAIPTTGAPLVPHGFRLRLYTDRPRRVDPAARARYYSTRPRWPDDLAVPPPTLDPRLCDSRLYYGDDCYFEIAPAQVAAARRHADSGPFAFAGEVWSAYFLPWYRGESVIEGVRECVARLERAE